MNFCTLHALLHTPATGRLFVVKIMRIVFHFFYGTWRSYPLSGTESLACCCSERVYPKSFFGTQ